uniref:Uncharacterized protein n=1 Tax=Caenorhabditis japonica TaxID=281687 RepID=A0A8R1ELB2_CAEJA
MLWPLLILKSATKYTIQIGLAMFTYNNGINQQPSIIMAATTTSLIPVIVVYMFLQRYIIESIALSGVSDMKKTVLLILSFVLVFTMAACTGSSGKDVTGGVQIEKVSDMQGTVRVALAGWQLENGIDALTGNPTIGLNEYLDKTFKKMYPNIKLEVYQIPWENVKAKQTAMLLSGDADVLYTGGAFASQWYQEGLLRDLDDLIEKDTSFDPNIYLEGIMNNSYSTKSPDGSKQFGIPVALGRRMTIYDKKLFEDWGVDTLTAQPGPEEILDKAKKMTGKNPKT